MSAATSWTSWPSIPGRRGARHRRGPLARRPRLRPAGGDGRPSKAGEDPGGCVRAARARRASRTVQCCRACRCGSTSWSWSRATGSATTGTRCERVGAAVWRRRRLGPAATGPGVGHRRNGRSAGPARPSACARESTASSATGGVGQGSPALTVHGAGTGRGPARQGRGATTGREAQIGGAAGAAGGEGRHGLEPDPCYTPARSGFARAARSIARATRRGAHTRTVPTGTVPAPDIARDRPPATRSAEERTEQEVAHRAVRLDAAAAGGRSPLRPPDPPLESQDAPVHLCRAQRDPHHRPRPDRPAPGRRAGVRPRDGRPGRPGPLRGHQEAGPGAGRPGGHARQPAVRQQALAGRDADQLRDDQEADRPPRAARGAPAERRLRADDEEGSCEADRGDGQAPGHARRDAQDEAPAGRHLHRRPAS